MKSFRWILLGTLVCFGLVILSYTWMSALMDSLFAYRSPLASNPPAPAHPIRQPLTRRVVLVLVDGLRDDTSRDAKVMPFLNELRAQGASASMHSRPPSFSAPGYAVLLTGAWPDLSDGPTMNPDDGEVPRTFTQDNLFSAAHRAGLHTAVSGLDWFQGLIREIASQLDLEQDTILIFSDHGHIDRGGHGGQDPITLVEPFVLAGAGIVQGDYGDVQMIDLAPTVAALLGTNIPATNQGQVLIEAMKLTSDQKANIMNAFFMQQDELFKKYTAALPLKQFKGIVDNAHVIMEVIKQDHLNQDRLPRIILATIIALMPVWVLFQKRGRTVAWLLGCAALYLILFNLGYAVISGRTYSLSSVGGVEDIALFTTKTAILSFTLVWCLLVYGIKLNRMAPHQAAETSLALTFVTIYLLTLPALWSYAFNGPLITWTLPDMASMYIGFLSTLQILIIAAVSLLFTGGAALLAFQTQKR